jgi:hypothetical protein
MKDQEKIEYSAYTLLERWRRKARDEHPLISPDYLPEPPAIKPRNFATNRPSRTRYVIERPKRVAPPRYKQPVY